MKFFLSKFCIIALICLSYTIKANTFNNQDINSISNLKKILFNKEYNISNKLAEKVINIVMCSKKMNVEHNNIISIIDYSLPSNQKRFWSFDLNKNKVIAHSHVSHGITAGELYTDKFSNVSNSKAGSIGVYKTGESYRGREGLSLRLLGLEDGFNDNARRRFIVMHGGWYMHNDFIKRYGRPGRSWGCPALPSKTKNGVVNTIKDGSLFIVYYPSIKWFNNSKFLNCDALNQNNKEYYKENLEPILVENAKRDNILYFDLNENNIREREDPVISLSADDYEIIFKKTPPLKRMIRRRINNKEFIVLSDKEFEIIHKNNNINDRKKLKFIIPVLKRINGRTRTKMKILDYGNVLRIKEHSFDNLEKNQLVKNYDIIFNSQNKNSYHVKPTNEFIRWIGL